jgi:hypothetical protein
MAVKQLVQPTTSLEYPGNHFSKGLVTSVAFTDSGTDAYRRAILALPRKSDGWRRLLPAQREHEVAQANCGKN